MTPFIGGSISVRFEVADTGVGFEPASAERLFQNAVKFTSAARSFPELTWTGSRRQRGPQRGPRVVFGAADAPNSPDTAETSSGARF
jgi:hypothetical protein